MENRWWMFVGILASDGRRSATGKEPLQVGTLVCVSSLIIRMSSIHHVPRGWRQIRNRCDIYPYPGNLTTTRHPITCIPGRCRFHALYIYKIYVPYGRTTHPRRKKKTFFLPFLNIMHIVHAYGCANSDENISFVTDIIREPKPVWILLLLLYYGSAIVLECNICLQQQLWNKNEYDEC